MKKLKTTRAQRKRWQRYKEWHARTRNERRLFNPAYGKGTNMYGADGKFGRGPWLKRLKGGADRARGLALALLNEAFTDYPQLFRWIPRETFSRAWSIARKLLRRDARQQELIEAKRERELAKIEGRVTIRKRA